ncbi:hypothetical protein [Novipirellula caenicola]|uniref:Type II secretion system protein n=1 Tax=Novipirellula caenicola TaxID=1536901 RepID=A0ABP9W375_9BACT
MNSFTRQNVRQHQRGRPRRRSGATLFELMVTATLVVSGVGMVAPLTVRCGRLWQQTRHRQMALDELNNHMERLIALPTEELEKQAEAVTVSDAARTLLPEAVMEAEIVRSNNETQLHLSIDWKRVGDPDPLTLVGWIKSEDDL